MAVELVRLVFSQTDMLWHMEQCKLSRLKHSSTSWLVLPHPCVSRWYGYIPSVCKWYNPFHHVWGLCEYCWAIIKHRHQICMSNRKHENLFLNLWVWILFCFLQYVQKLAALKAECSSGNLKRGERGMLSHLLLLFSFLHLSIYYWKMKTSLWYVHQKKLFLWWMIGGQGQ